MLTKKEFQTVSRVLKVSCSLYALPFDWDSTNAKVVETNSNLKLCVSRFLVIWKIIYTVVSVFRLHPRTSWNSCDRNIVKELFHSILSLCYVAGSAESVVLHFYSGEAVLLFNQLVLFNRNQGKDL